MTDSKRRGRPPGDASADTAQRILDTARRLFAERGYAETTIKLVAARAGLTSAALYHYHPSKLDLYVAVHAECRQRFLAVLDAAQATALTFTDKVLAILDASERLQADDPIVGWFTASARVDVARRPELQAALRRGSDWWTQLCRTVVDTGVSTGELRADDHAVVMAFLSALLLGLGETAALDERLHARALAGSRLVLDAVLRGRLGRAAELVP